MDLWHYPRTDFANHILNGMKNNMLDRVTIFAPRKRGKTQFITKDIQPACENMGILPIYIDFWLDRKSPENAFIDGVTEALESRQSIFEKILKVLKFTPQVSSSGAKLKVEPSSEAPDRHSLSIVFRMLNAHDQPILLLLDEVQHLATDPSFEDFTAALRSFMTARGDNKIKGIFTGSSLQGLRKLFKQSKAPFYDSSQTIDFTPLGKEFVEFQLGAFATVTGGVNLDFDDAFGIFKQQQLSPARFSGLLKKMALQGVHDISEGFKTLDHEYLVAESKQFEETLGTLKALDKILLNLIAKGEGNNIYTKERIKGIEALYAKETNASLISASIKRLAEKDLIYSQSRGEWDMSDPAMREFLLSPYR